MGQQVEDIGWVGNLDSFAASFREFFDVPKQLEKEINATGSGVIVDAQRGYVLTANHVVARASTVQITTKDGRKFAARLVGRDAPTDVALLQIKDPAGLTGSGSAIVTRCRSATSSLQLVTRSGSARP